VSEADSTFARMRDRIAALEAEVGELQTIVDNEQAAHIDCAASGEAQRQRAEKAEAELE